MPVLATSRTPFPGLTDSQLAVLLRQTRWAIDDAAYDLPTGHPRAARGARRGFGGPGGPRARLGETVIQRHRHRDPIVLCGAEVTDPDPYDPDQDCPGCGDCLRYCPHCVRVAATTVADSTQDPGRPPV
ncbi:MAG: hypothetical protein ACRDSL_14660 [Pseudonocardiaceae bacterium]